MEKIYNILLSNSIIGTSLFEYGDPTMGIAFGAIKFIDDTFTFDFFQKYFKENNIKAKEYPDIKLIVTTDGIVTLTVLNEKGVEIKANWCNIEGMDSEGFQITMCISYPLYEEEFPNHIKTSKERFK